MSATPVRSAWYRSPSILPAAQSLLALVDPPETPVEVPAFLAGVRAALGALSPDEVRLSGMPISALLDHLASTVASDAKGTRTQWDQDPMRGHGATAYRAFAQPPPPGGEGGYATLKAVLLGLLLARSSNSAAVSVRAIEQVVRFVRLGSGEVHGAHDLARTRIIASLPSTLIPSELQQALAQREGVPESLHPRLDEVARASRKLFESFWLLDRGEPVPAADPEPTSAEAPAGALKSLSTESKPVRQRPPKRPPHSLSTTSAGVEEPDATFVHGPAHAPSDETAKAIADAAEAIDDRLSMAEGLMLETSPSTSAVKRYATALRLLSDVRQGLWSRFQWDALSTGEMRNAVGILLSEISGLAGAHDATRHEALTLGLLSACTGLPRARCHSLRTTQADDEANPTDFLQLELGKLNLPLVGREDRYAPKPEQLPFLRAVTDTLPIYLPREVTAELGRLIPSEDGYAFRSSLAVLEGILDSLFEVARAEEPRITAARLARGHQLEVLAQCGHPPSAQMVTGQTLGTAPVGLSYYTARAKSLQEIYDRAISNHGLTPSEHAEEVPTLLVGSKLALTDEAWESAVQSISRGLVNRPREKRIAGRELLYLHDELVRATATIWMASTGFRPTFRIGELRACHINWLSNSAVIIDKIVDTAHEGRLVPLAPTLLASLGAYGAILDRITQTKDIAAAVRTAAREALTGAGALFFFLDRHGKAQPMNPQYALSRLPAGWNLPFNFLRHRIATRLLEVECPGPYVQALMGHLEQGIQPFGPDSFMVPSEYLAVTRNAIERVLQEDGWRPLLGGFGDTRTFLEHAPPARDDVLTVEGACEDAVRTAFKRQREEVDTLRETMREQIRADVQELVQQARPDLIQSPDQPHRLDSSSITALRMAVTDNVGSAALVELRVRALRDYLLERREAHGWQVKRLPQFFVFQPEPSVQHPTYVPAHLTLERLRAHFVKHLAIDPGKVAASAASSKLNAVLALILWQGVSSWDRLEKILEGLREAEPISSGGEGVAVPIRISRYVGDPNPEASSEVLTGAVALAALTARLHVTVVDRKELETLVAEWVPTTCLQVPKSRMLDALFALARIGHRFEAPSPLRMAWSEQLRSVNMPLDRLRALFGQQASRSRSIPQDSEEEAPATRGQDGVLSTDGHADYKWLRGVLGAAKDATRQFPDEPKVAASAKPQRTETDQARTRRTPPSRSRLRAEACRRLRERLRNWPYDGTLVRALTAYALDRLENGTPWSSEIVPDTVYKYVVGAGGALRAYDPDMHLVDYEEEDFAEIYDSCIRRAPQRYKEKLRGYLAYFHRYLVEQHRAPPVSMGLSVEAIIGLPEVGYIAPNEMAASMAQLEAELATADPLAGPVTEIRATLAAISLGFAAGSRKKETLLREDRELVTAMGRRALLVRKNRWATTKTHRSTRVVDLEPSMPQSGWVAINTWRDKSGSLRSESEAQRSMLLAGTVDGRIPLHTEGLTQRIAATLRRATRRQDAQVNWWRHTAVSNDILVLFATSEILEAVRRGAHDEGHEWLPDPIRMRQSLGGELPLSQAHAAGFRSRRGHAQMKTPVATYTHTTGLVEPWACRQVSDTLSSGALATIAGLRPAALRQRLSRAELSASPSRAAVRYLVKQGAPLPSDDLAEEPQEAAPMARSARDTVDPEQFGEALLRSLREGDLQLLVDALHLSTGAAQHLYGRLRAAVDANVFGLNLGLELPVQDDSTTVVPRARANPSAPLSFERVDVEWIRRCIGVRIANPNLAAVWSIVLRGLDPRSGHIAVSGDQEFISLLNHLPIATDQGDASKYRVGIVVDKSVRKTDRSRVLEITAGTASRDCQVHEADLRAPKGWALAGAVVETFTTGRRQISGLAFLALASSILR